MTSVAEQKDHDRQEAFWELRSPDERQFRDLGMPPEEWPAELFQAWLIATVPPAERPAWCAKRVPADVREAGWPPSVLEQAALQRPAVLPSHATGAQQTRIDRSNERLKADPAVMAERDRLMRSVQPGDALSSSYDEIMSFAESHAVQGVPPADVRMFLSEAVWRGQLPRPLRDSVENLGWPVPLPNTQPAAWLNVLPHPVPFALEPESIAIVLTPGMTRKDVEAVWPSVEAALTKLGGSPDKGGRPPKEDMDRRMEELWNQDVPRKDILTRLQEEFPDQAPATLEALFKRHSRYRSDKKLTAAERS